MTREIQLDQLIIRWAGNDDQEALARLAALDGVPIPMGRVMIVEGGGAIVAAVPEAGRPFSDPFLPTRALVDLLVNQQVAGHASRAQTSLMARIGPMRRPRQPATSHAP
jgi:hypothetical protein